MTTSFWVELLMFNKEHMCQNDQVDGVRPYANSLVEVGSS